MKTDYRADSLSPCSRRARHRSASQLFADRSAARSPMWRFFSLATCLVLVVGASETARGEVKIENYPDGAKHLVYDVAADGTKHGSYKELFPDGKSSVLASYIHDKLQGSYKSFFASNGKVKTSAFYRSGELEGKFVERAESGQLLHVANYHAGKLNGEKQDFTAGSLTGWEFWIGGKMMIPKMPGLIAAEVAKINQAKIKWTGEFPPVDSETASDLKEPQVLEQNEAALRELMIYRYLADLPYADLTINRVQMAHAQAGAEIMSRINEMTHFPKNPGMPEADFKFAYEGTSHSNIHNRTPKGESIPGATKDWIGDSDERNIDRVGHRRWCLNPSMTSTGFGLKGNFAAMWSFDQSRTEIPDFDYVAFPPRGETPTENLRQEDAWSVSLNPKKFQPPDEKSVKVSIWWAKFVPRQSLFEKGSEPLTLDHFNVSLVRTGIANCIIFRSAAALVKPDTAYWVEIKGLQDSDGKPATIEYPVFFFSLATIHPERMR